MIEQIPLGNSGLDVSNVALGCGGPSRLGQASGKSAEESLALVRRALDAGVTLIDTAEAYGTEEIVGRAVAGRRDEVVISTKASIHPDEGVIVLPEDVRTSLEGSLRRLGTDRVDLYLLHAVLPEQYDAAVNQLLPELSRLREQGKVRAIGLSEAFIPDPRHEMMSRAVEDAHWDAVMVGFNILNQSARERVFLKTLESKIGTIVMFAVRKAFSRPERLRELIAELDERGLVDAELDPEDPLGFLVQEGEADSLVEAAYRFCRHEPGVDVVLTGTGDPEHLEENLAALAKPPLPSTDQALLLRAFARIDSVSGD